MTANEIIEKKISGEALSESEIEFLIQSYKAGKVSDGKMVKFMKSVNETNFSYDEAFYLANSMAKTGKMLNIGETENDIVVDKHSAGIISDASTIIFMSVLASLDVKCIKVMSGYFGNFRNSIDRFDAIKNFNARVSSKKFLEILNKTKMAVYEEADDIAPVDKKLYALRKKYKITSIPLVASSILSKKIASGANVLVFDVKEGEGSISSDPKFSRTLAQYLTNIAKSAGIASASVVTNLDSPLSSNIGNKPEMKEAVLALKNGEALYGSKLLLVAKELVELALILSKKAKGRADASEMFQDAIKSGKAYEKFCEFLSAYGGDISSVLKPDTLLDGVGATYIVADGSGYVCNINLRALKKSFDTLLLKNKNAKDPNAGINILLNEGAKVNTGDKLARLIFSLDNKNIFSARQTLLTAFEISNTKPEVKNVFDKVVV